MIFQRLQAQKALPEWALQRLLGQKVRTGGSGKRLQLFARFKADSLAGLDANFSARARISSDSCLARLHVEDAESAQFYPLSLGQSFFHRSEYGFDSNFSFGLRNSRTVDYVVDKIELNQ